MNKKSRIKFKCAIMTVETERQVCEMHIHSRTELGCAIMTAERVSKICRMHKNRRTQMCIKPLGYLCFITFD